MDFHEGYADGLAGAGMQDRPEAGLLPGMYERGFVLGSLDRKAMLVREGAFAAWADGLGDEVQA